LHIHYRSNIDEVNWPDPQELVQFEPFFNRLERCAIIMKLPFNWIGPQTSR